MLITTHPNDIKERLSIAYLTAVAARAGCQISKLEVDKQSIDATVRPISGRKLAIDFQIKATSQACADGIEITFALPVNNYDDLRDTTCTAPHYLLVLLLDPDEGVWLQLDDNALLIKRCAYWLDLRGQPPTSNKDTITVKVPMSQRFDVAALETMLQTEFSRLSAPPGAGS